MPFYHTTNSVDLKYRDHELFLLRFWYPTTASVIYLISFLRYNNVYVLPTNGATSLSDIIFTILIVNLT